MSHFYSGRPSREHMWRELLNTQWPHEQDVGGTSAEANRDPAPQSLPTVGSELSSRQASPVMGLPPGVISSPDLTADPPRSVSDEPSKQHEDPTSMAFSESDALALVDILDQYAGEMQSLDDMDLDDLLGINQRCGGSTRP